MPVRNNYSGKLTWLGMDIDSMNRVDLLAALKVTVVAIRNQAVIYQQLEVIDNSQEKYKRMNKQKNPGRYFMPSTFVSPAEAQSLRRAVLTSKEVTPGLGEAPRPIDGHVRVNG